MKRGDPDAEFRDKKSINGKRKCGSHSNSVWGRVLDGPDSLWLDARGTAFTVSVVAKVESREMTSSAAL